MNARIKASDRATNKQRQMARELVKEELRKQAAGNMRRIFKLFCLCLNEEYGFGRGRLSNLIHGVSELATQYEKDEVFWTHVDKRMEQMSMEFQKEDYEEMDK